MANQFPQSLAMLLAFWINGFLHGIYLVLFFRWAMNRQRAAAFYFVTFCWVAFVLSNIDFAINLYLLVKGFWFSLPHGGPDVFFADLQNWQTVLREITYQLIVSASDTLMIYRLYRIWRRNIYVIIIPIILLLAETISGFMAVGRLSLGQFLLLPTAVDLLVSFNTALQIVLTVLIVVKLLDPREIKFLPQAQRTKRFQLVRCVVESGLLVTVALILDLALFVRGILFHWVFNISLTQLYAITTVLIVLRMNDINDAQSRSHSAPSHSGSNYSGNRQNYSHPRAPVALPLFKEPLPSDLVDIQKSSIGTLQDGVEMLDYDKDRGERNGQKLYVHVQREV